MQKSAVPSSKLFDRYMEASKDLDEIVGKGEDGKASMTEVIEGYQVYMAAWKSFNQTRFRAPDSETDQQWADSINHGNTIFARAVKLAAKLGFRLE